MKKSKPQTIAQRRAATRERVKKWRMTNPVKYLAIRYRAAKRFCERYEAGKFGPILESQITEAPE